MTIRAVLFDVGGPIDTDADIIAVLAAEGIGVDAAAYEAASAWAVEHFAPDAHTAIIWQLTSGDRAMAERAHRTMLQMAHAQNSFELRDGIGEVIAWLHGRGLRLGLAANQPESTLAVLAAHGIGHYFHHREVSGTHGYRKPDVRLFLRCCDDLQLAAAECIMVGDRIDNDIGPARVLGMRTVLFRTGRHIAQQPRCAEEVPDAEVRSVGALRATLAALL